MVGSLDIESLYPSIKTKDAARICKEKIQSSSVEFQGVDYKWALTYLTLTMSPREIVDAKIQYLLPRRLHKQGPKPGISGALDKEPEERFWFPKKLATLNQEDKKLIMACLVEQLVKVVFQNHFYFWNNRLYQQQDGAPMGLRSSSPVSRVVMDW